MNATDKFVAASAHVDEAAIAPLPNSRKILRGIHATGWWLRNDVDGDPVTIPQNAQLFE